ncbi:unnamed protein product [Vitrella brassicaformis CCMP3155]|uniref:Phosphodiesterase n=3 Tax=Vitrella brassicaformis TaxID=1169539 RepID=A0A0G4GDP8_VITBC|nr:unnamed protein product [Vitrella brassicaformis CCMP3155]|eukprot:CEM27371.1 unnamed protein product [Vitrella brassicaformis CCMP3155]
MRHSVVEFAVPPARENRARSCSMVTSRRELRAITPTKSLPPKSPQLKGILARKALGTATDDEYAEELDINTAAGTEKKIAALGPQISDLTEAQLNSDYLLKKQKSLVNKMPYGSLLISLFALAGVVSQYVFSSAKDGELSTRDLAGVSVALRAVFWSLGAQAVIGLALFVFSVAASKRERLRPVGDYCLGGGLLGIFLLTGMFGDCRRAAVFINRQSCSSLREERYWIFDSYVLGWMLSLVTASCTLLPMRNRVAAFIGVSSITCYFITTWVVFITRSFGGGFAILALNSSLLAVSVCLTLVGRRKAERQDEFNFRRICKQEHDIIMLSRHLNNLEETFLSPTTKKDRASTVYEVHMDKLRKIMKRLESLAHVMEALENQHLDALDNDINASARSIAPLFPSLTNDPLPSTSSAFTGSSSGRMKDVKMKEGAKSSPIPSRRHWMSWKEWLRVNAEKIRPSKKLRRVDKNRAFKLQYKKTVFELQQLGQQMKLSLAALSHIDTIMDVKISPAQGVSGSDPSSDDPYIMDWVATNFMRREGQDYLNTSKRSLRRASIATTDSTLAQHGGPVVFGVSFAVTANHSSAPAGQAAETADVTGGMLQKMPSTKHLVPLRNEARQAPESAEKRLETQQNREERVPAAQQLQGVRTPMSDNYAPTVNSQAVRAVRRALLRQLQETPKLARDPAMSVPRAQTEGVFRRGSAPDARQSEAMIPNNQNDNHIGNHPPHPRRHSNPRESVADSSAVEVIVDHTPTPVRHRTEQATPPQPSKAGQKLAVRAVWNPFRRSPPPSPYAHSDSSLPATSSPLTFLRTRLFRGGEKGVRHPGLQLDTSIGIPMNSPTPLRPAKLKHSGKREKEKSPPPQEQRRRVSNRMKRFQAGTRRSEGDAQSVLGKIGSAEGNAKNSTKNSPLDSAQHPRLFQYRHSSSSGESIGSEAHATVVIMGSDTHLERETAATAAEKGGPEAVRECIPLPPYHPFVSDEVKANVLASADFRILRLDDESPLQSPIRLDEQRKTGPRIAPGTANGSDEAGRTIAPDSLEAATETTCFGPLYPYLSVAVPSVLPHPAPEDANQVSSDAPERLFKANGRHYVVDPKTVRARSGLFLPVDLFELCKVYGIGENWNASVLGLAGRSLNHSLLAVGTYLLAPVICDRDELGERAPQLMRFLHKITETYLNNPYHSEAHAAEVCHSTVVLARMLRVWDNLDMLGQLSLLLSALCHDVGHVGRNNAFLIAASSELAIIYNDKSPLENMHASTTFKLLSDDKCDFVDALSPADRATFRRYVIDLILQTDMQMHFEEVSKFRIRRQAADFDMVESAADRWLTARLIMKAADIGHSCKTWAQHKRWSYLIVHEFYLQGDEERVRGMEVSPLCDRQNAADLPKSQIGFLGFVCRPCFEELQALDTSGSIAKVCLDELQENSRRWSVVETAIESKRAFHPDGDLVPLPSKELPSPPQLSPNNSSSPSHDGNHESSSASASLNADEREGGQREVRVTPSARLVHKTREQEKDRAT